MGYNWIEMVENTEDQPEARRWALGWRNAGLMLDRLKKSELQRIDISVALNRLARAFESCRIHFKPAPHSGLIEQQRWFQKLRK